MANAIIGALRVVLGMDSAAFNDGVGAAQKRIAGFRKSMQRAGQSLTRAGTRMSVGITGSLTALGAMSTAASRTLGELKNLADVAGVEAERFKVLSLASSQLGVEQEKLADILKDVNDKFGDYFQTGAGPLADFFDNIAPKVGLTKEAFRGLSSDDALKLYVKALQDANLSQQEMTFYMEALASDATALIPLFRDNAAAINEMERKAKALGFALNGETIDAAQNARREFGLISEVMKTQLQAALAGLLPAFTDLAKLAVPAVQKLVEVVTRISDGFRSLSPETQKFIVIGGALAAAIGPVVTGLGLMLTALSPLAGLILAVVSPLGLLTAGIAAAGVAIYQNWGTLKEDFPAITGAIEAALDGLKAAFDFLLTAAETAFQGITLTARQVATAVEMALSTDFKAALMAGVDAVKQFAVDLLAALAKLLTDVIAAALNIGHEIVAGIKRGLQQKWQELKDYVSGIGSGLAQGFKDALGIRSPSRVFREFGGFIVDGLVKGIQGGLGTIRAAVGQMSGALQMEDLKNQAQQAQGVFQKMARTAANVFGQIGKGIGESIRGAKKFSEVLAEVAQSLAKVLLQQAQASLANLFGGSGSVGGSLVSGLLGGLVGFANGGSFEVGGAGGIDSQVVAFRASPNETVHVTKPGQGLGDNPPQRFHWIVEASEDLRVVAADAGRSATVEVVKANNRAFHQGQRRG